MIYSREEESLIRELEQFNRRYALFGRGDRIIVAVSGGADSVCLLELLYELAEKWELSLFVLHVHHGIRGEEADGDARFVEELAEERHIPFRLVKADVPAEAGRRGCSEEEAGRCLRYEALEQYRREMEADRIAVAHHQDDQAETVLFHLFRGSGPRGLAGIPVRRGVIIRPLLFASRAGIQEYLERRGIAWRQDATNRELVYARNRIRHQIMPAAQEYINAEAGKHIAQAAEKLAGWRTYIERQGREAYSRCVTRERRGLSLKTELFLREDPVIQAEILGQIFAGMIEGARDVGQVHYDQIRSLFSAPAGKRIDLPGGLCAEKLYDGIRFREREDGGEEEPVCVVCRIPSEHIVERGGIVWRFVLEMKKREDLTEEITQKDYTKLFDYDMIKDSLMIRSPQREDYFVMDGAGRRKRLSRYYIDRKVPRSERPAQLVVAEGDHVLWALPDRISETYKITDNTERVLVITKERIP